jgi:hypothetical protein
VPAVVLVMIALRASAKSAFSSACGRSACIERRASDAPTSFLRKRWQPYVLTETGVDRHFYELAVLTELKNGLRAGDVWVPGSRQFKDFEEYLLGRERFAELRDRQALPVAIEADSGRYLQRRLALLKEKLHQVDQLAGLGELPNAEITGELLKVSPLRNRCPKRRSNSKTKPSPSCRT